MEAKTTLFGKYIPAPNNTLESIFYLGMAALIEKSGEPLRMAVFNRETSTPAMISSKGDRIAVTELVMYEDKSMGMEVSYLVDDGLKYVGAAKFESEDEFKAVALAVIKEAVDA